MSGFDDYIKKEFLDYSPDVSPGMWERIVVEKERQKKPFGFWLWFLENRKVWLAAMLIGSFVVTGILLYKVNSNDVAFKNIKHSAVYNSYTNNNSSSTENKTSVSLSGMKKPVAVTGSNKSNTNQVTGITALTSGNKSVYHTAEKEVTSAVRNSSAHPKTTRIKTQKMITASSDETFISSPIWQENKKITSPETATNKKSENKILTDKMNFESVPLWIKKYDSKNASSSSLKNAIHFPECPTVEKDAALNKKYFEVYMGPDYGIRSMTDTAVTEYPVLFGLQRRVKIYPGIYEWSEFKNRA
jgi:hypothetical protein